MVAEMKQNYMKNNYIFRKKKCMFLTKTIFFLRKNFFFKKIVCLQKNIWIPFEEISFCKKKIHSVKKFHSVKKDSLCKKTFHSGK